VLAASLSLHCYGRRSNGRRSNDGRSNVGRSNTTIARNLAQPFEQPRIRAHDAGRASQVSSSKIAAALLGTARE
jgi:hypothetical protein